MKVIKKYTAIQLQKTTVDDFVDVKLTYGSITGRYFERDIPEDIFDTEEGAIEYAQKRNQYGVWLILPIVLFDGFES